MKQQINLYTPKVAAARSIWSLPSVIMMVVLVTLIAAFASWGVTQYADAQVAKLNALKAKNDGLPDQIKMLEKQRKDLKPDPALIQEQKRIRERIAEKQELSEMLNQMQPGVSNQGFSPYLYGLAAASRRGVWITQFDLNLAQSQVQLNGLSREANDVPLLLRDLGETAAFRSIRIADFSVAKEVKDHRFKVLAYVTGGGDGE
ncbi:MAG: hypothetical protein KC477_04375 [Oceanospirillaceae bacterium]|nr:hypothetical protein [Oceanospirillaceae bacterium]